MDCPLCNGELKDVVTDETHVLYYCKFCEKVMYIAVFPEKVSKEKYFPKEP